MEDISDRCVGALLGVMVCDALGAATEGWPGEEVRSTFPGGVTHYTPCRHMGVYSGGLRRAMYTDDTQSTLALACSIAEEGVLDAKKAAKSYADFFMHKPQRGYPNSAAAVLVAISKGEDPAKTGTLAFPDGSFANGGAMRISPVGIAFRNAPDGVLREAVRMAVVSSHVHPEGIDGAFVLAKGVAMLLRSSVEQLQQQGMAVFLAAILDSSTEPRVHAKVKQAIDAAAEVEKEQEPLKRSEAEYRFARDIGGDFQIRASEAIGVVALAWALHWRDPLEAVTSIMAYGGDTDTTGSMLAAWLGALHGRRWMASEWVEEIENGPFGRDYCISLALRLHALDLKSMSDIISI